MTGKRASEEREVYAEVHHAAEDRLQRDPELYTLRAGDWKYIHRPATGKHELYDLSQDPRELHKSTARPPARARARAPPDADGGARGCGGLAQGLSEAQLEELRKLGYL